MFQYVSKHSSQEQRSHYLPSLDERRNKSPRRYLERSRSPLDYSDRSSPYLELSKSPPWSPQSHLHKSGSPSRYLSRSKSPLQRHDSPLLHLRGNQSSPYHLGRKSQIPHSPQTWLESPPRYLDRGDSPPSYLRTAVHDQYFSNNDQYHNNEGHQLYANSRSRRESNQFPRGPPDVDRGNIRHMDHGSLHSPQESSILMRSFLRPGDGDLENGKKKTFSKKVMSVQEVDEMTIEEISGLRVSGAAHKKIRSLVSQGIPYIQAKRMVVKECFIREWSNQFKLKSETANASQNLAVSSSTTQESENLSSQMNNEKVHSDMKEDQDLKRPILESSNPNSKESTIVDVTVVHAEYPDYWMELDQLKAVQTAITRIVEGLSRDGLQICIVKFQYGPGSLIVSCADQTSAKRLKAVVSQIKPWDGAVLRTLGETKVEPLVKCTVFVPDEYRETLSSKKILSRLEISNRGLNTHLWKILNSIPKRTERGKVWVFAMNTKSLEMLKQLNMRPYFGFGMLKFKLRKK